VGRSPKSSHSGPLSGDPDLPSAPEEVHELQATGAPVAALSDTSPLAPAPPPTTGSTVHRWFGDRLVPGVVLGIAVPLAVVAGASMAKDPVQYRPLALLVGVVVGMAVFVGSRSALVAAVTAVLLGWWELIEPAGSFRLTTFADAAGLVLYTATLGGVVALVEKLDRAGQRVAEEKKITDELLDQTPVGIALFDRDLRFTRVNRHLAALNDRPAAEHLGRRPSEISPFASEAWEHLLTRALRNEEIIGDRHVTAEHPSLGEKHWRVSYYPVSTHSPGGGVGATVEDITSEVIRVRQAELLLEVTRAFGTALSVSAAEQEVAELVAMALKARVLVIHARPDGAHVVRASAGYGDQDGWPASMRSGQGEGLSTCLNERRQVTSVLEDGATGVESAARLAMGDRTVIWQPAFAAASGAVVGAFSVAWPTRSEVTPESHVLLETIATIAALSTERIELFAKRANDRFSLAMNAMIEQVTVCQAVRNDDGDIIDFVVDFVNDAASDGAARDGDQLLGRLVCDLYPSWRSSGMFDAFAEVVCTGVPLVRDRVHYTDQLDDGTVIEGWWNLQVVRFDDGYLAASREVTEVVEAERHAREAARVAEREAIAVELLQRAALPAELPRSTWFSLGAAYRPAAVGQPIGGDWYDAFPLCDERICLVIADVSGHGPEAAAFMLQVRNVMRAVAVREHDPATILATVNEVLDALDRPSLFVTACCAIVDRLDRTLSWASAGHPPPVLVTSTGASALMVEPGPPLAVYPRSTWTSNSTRLNDGDLVVGYTDGLIERRGETIDAGLDRLKDMLWANAHLPPPDLAEHLAATVIDPSDDIAVICLQVSGPVEFSVPAD